MIHIVYIAHNMYHFKSIKGSVIVSTEFFITLNQYVRTLQRVGYL